MKRVLLCICVIGIVGLATVNVNFAFNSEIFISNLSLAKSESLANSENGSRGNCRQTIVTSYVYQGDMTEKMETFTCLIGGGLEEVCFSGYRIYYNGRLTYDCTNWESCD